MNENHRCLQGSEDVLLFDLDPVDAAYATTAFVNRPESLVRRAFRWLGPCGLYRLEGNRQFNCEPLRIVSFEGGPPPQAKVVCPPTAGITDSGGLYDSAETFECWVELPATPCGFAIYLVKAVPTPPEGPVEPPVIVPPRYYLTATPKSPGDALLVARGIITAERTPELDAQFLPPCWRLDSHDRLQKLADDIVLELESCSRQIVASFCRCLGNEATSRASKAWREHFLCGYRAWRLGHSLDDRPCKFLDRLSWFLTTHVQELVELNLQPRTEPLLQTIHEARMASDLGRSMLSLHEAVVTFGSVVAECLAEEMRGRSHIRHDNKPQCQPQTVWSEIIANLPVSLGEELDRLKANSVRVALRCVGPEGEQNREVPIHPTANVACIARRGRLTRQADGLHSFTYRAKTEDREHALIRFFIRTDLTPDVTSLSLEGVVS